MARSFRLTRKRYIYLITVLLTALIAVAQQQGWLGETMQENQPGYYSVTRFVDGDTVQIDMNGKDEKIRFVGVDTPETHKPNSPVQCYGPAASAFLKNTIGDKPLRLESDPKSTNRDRYNRLLRYVYLPDGTLLNKLIIEKGYGFYYPYFPFSKSAEFDAAQQTAQASKAGLWRNCTPTKTDRGGYISNNQDG